MPRQSTASPSMRNLWQKAKQKFSVLPLALPILQLEIQTGAMQAVGWGGRRTSA
jgi:hypothetical protein